MREEMSHPDATWWSEARSRAALALPPPSTILDPPSLLLPPTQGKRVKYFQIYRWDPEQSSKPYVATYPVDLGECGPMVRAPLLPFPPSSSQRGPPQDGDSV